MRFLLLMLGITTIVVLSGSCSQGQPADDFGYDDDGGGSPPIVVTACDSFCNVGSQLGGQFECGISCQASCATFRSTKPDCANALDAQLNCYVTNVNLCKCGDLDVIDCTAAARACAPEIAAYASCAAQNPTSSGSGGAGSVHEGGNLGVIDSGNLNVSLANYPQSCGGPVNSTCPTTELALNLVMGLGRVSPGTVTSLDELDAGYTGLAPYNGSCSETGGRYTDGNVEVLALDDTTVSLRLSGTATYDPELPGGMDGDYLIDLCDPVPPPGNELSNAVAIETTTPAPALTIHLTNVPNTCADPDASAAVCSTELANVTISLPEAMQAVGTYPLDGLAVYGDCSPYGTACGCHGGILWGGTIEVKSIDANNIVFALAGTDPVIWRHPNIDGTYNATLCKP
jgi:hypothetical protein